MSNDLISRSALISHIESESRQLGADYDTEQILGDIEDAPTAYDVDKVVEQLEEERELSYADFDRYVEELSPCLDAEYDDFFHRGLERAIKIVKGGGVNE